MGTSIAPEQDELDKALAAIRSKGPRAASADPMDAALAEIRTGGKPGDIVLPGTAATPKRKLGATRPLAPMPAQQDITRTKASATGGMEEQLQSHAPGQGGNLPNAIAESAMEMVTHPVTTARALAETPARAGYALGKFTRGEGSGREAAIGAAQTAAMLLGGPAERALEPIAARVVGEAAAPIVARAATGAAAGATFSPDRPAIGAIIGGAAGALSGRGKAAEKIARDRARFEDLAKQHPDWLGETLPPEPPKQLGDGTPAATATAKVTEQPAEPASPDFTVGEPNAPPAAPPPPSPIVQEKGVFGGGLEQHGQDFAAGKVPPPETSITPPAPAAPAPAEPSSPINPRGEEAVAAPAKEATAVAEKHDYASTQVNLPGKAAVGIKRLAASIPDEDLAADGREDNPHITVKYGLHGNPSAELTKLLENEPPVTVTLGKTSFFPNSESNSGDVLKADVDSPDLHRLNKLIADKFPHTDTHPDYKPHATIAYLKPGLGKKYAGDNSLAGEEIVLDHITFSGKDGKTIDIPLGAQAKHEAAIRERAKNYTGADLDRELKQLREEAKAAEKKPALVERRAEPTVDRPVWTPEQRAAHHTEEMRRYNTLERLSKPTHPDEMEKSLVRGKTEPFPYQIQEAAAAAAKKKLGKPKEPKGPVHELARTTAGRLRDNLETVKSDGLVTEMFRLLGAEDPRDQAAAIYRTVEADVSGTQYGKAIQVATRHGKGPSEQAKALHRIELKKGAAKRIEAVLNARGLTDEEITRRYVELTEIAADRKAEQEGLDTGTGDTSFDVGDYDTGDARTAAEGAAQEAGANAPAKGATAGSAKGAGRSASQGPPQSKAAASREVTPKRTLKGAISAREMAARAKAGETREAVTAITGEEPTPLSQDKRQSEMFSGEEAGQVPEDQSDLFSLERPIADVGVARMRAGIQTIITALDDAVHLSGPSKLVDTTGNAKAATLEKIAALPRTKELAAHFEKVFQEVLRTIVKRYPIDLPEWGGLDVAHDALGLNLSRNGIKQRATQLGLEYDGPLSNLLFVNPYMALVEMGASGKYFTDAESIAPLSETVFATIVHELAHQVARKEDEIFTHIHTRFAAAASRIAESSLAKLDQAWRVALAAGIRDDVITLASEVWYGARKQGTEDLSSRSGTGSPEGSTGRLHIGGDAAASHLRPLEGNAGLGEANAGRRLGRAAARAVRRGAGEGQAPGRGRTGLGDVAGLGGIRARSSPSVQGSEPVRAAGRLDKVKDDLKRMFAPATRGALAKETGHLTRATVGRMAQENEVAREALSGFAKAFDKLSREDRLDFIDKMENGAPQRTEQLSDAADTIRDVLDKSRDLIRSLGTGHLENYIENYFPHIWTNPGEAARLINSITGKRPLEGPRSFLKRRTIPTTKEGIELGLEPISTNPVDLALLKLREMNRYLMGQRVMNGMKDEGLAQFVHAFSKPPDGYARINDHVAMVYGPPTIPVHEAFDALVRDQLQKVMRSLGVLHDRPILIPRLGKDKWGAAYGSRKIDARFGGDATIIMHELGHILDVRYGLWDRLVEPVAKTANKKGKLVADRKHASNSKDAIANRKRIKEELRALADLRYEGKNPDLVGPSFKDYVRERPEQIANALHAYMYAKAKMQRVAPTVYSRLDEFIKADPALKPLADVEPSLALGSGVTEAPVGGMVVKGQYWAPSEAATIINNYLSPGLRGNSIYDAYMAVGNSMNQFQLGFSAFHLGFTSMDAGVSQVALSLRQLASGRPLRALGSFATSPAAPVTTIRRGIKLRQAYLHPDQANAELTQLVSALVQGGGRVRMDDLYKTGAIAGLRKAFHDHNPWGVAWRAFPALAEFAVKPVLEYVVPRQKLGVFYALMQLELAKLGKNPDPFQVRAVAARVWDSVDNRMGQLVYDNLFWNKTGKDLAMASVRAVGWNVGTWREIGGGAIDFATAYKRHKAGDEAFTNRMAYVIALPLFAGMMGAIYNYLATGEPPRELKDYFYPRTGKNDPDGNPERVQLPSYMKDLWAYGHHPVRTIESKLHPTIEAISEMLHNEDFYGTMIVDPDAPTKEKIQEYGKFMARAFSPFALRNAIEARRRAQSLLTSGESFIGITPAPREVVRTQAQNKMSEYLGRSAPASRTPEEADKGQVHRQVIEAVRKGEMLPTSVTDMMVPENGHRPKLSRETLFQWIGEAKQPTTVTQFKKLSFEEAGKVWELANDDEKAQWANAYRTKVVNARK
jgi:2'-5' RNA ligase